MSERQTPLCNACANGTLAATTGAGATSHQPQRGVGVWEHMSNTTISGLMAVPDFIIFIPPTSRKTKLPLPLSSLPTSQCPDLCSLGKPHPRGPAGTLPDILASVGARPRVLPPGLRLGRYLVLARDGGQRGQRWGRRLALERGLLGPGWQ